MVRYLTTVFSALLIGWSVFPSAAQAQTVCGERKAIVASLEKTYSEAPVSMGLGSNGAIIEVFASPFRGQPGLTPDTRGVGPPSPD